MIFTIVRKMVREIEKRVVREIERIRETWTTKINNRKDRMKKRHREGEVIYRNGRVHDR